MNLESVSKSVVTPEFTNKISVSFPGGATVIVTNGLGFGARGSSPVAVIARPLKSN